MEAKTINPSSALKWTGAALFMALVLFTWGCSPAKPQLASSPATYKTKKPTQHPEETEDSFIDENTGSVLGRNFPLAGTKWEWEGELNADHIDSLDHPTDYRLEFKPNGWFDFTADCRRGAGIYEIRGERISMAVIKSSHSACRAGSRADDFLGALEAARNFRLTESKLYFELKREAGTLVFGLKP